MTPHLHARKSTVDVDSDEDAEQRLGVDDGLTTTTTTTPTQTAELNGGETVNGIGHPQQSTFSSGGRFDGLLQSVGLDGKLRHLNELPAERKISVRDIFCNRELKLDHVKAIGFDMDYTLAQYKQPAFDQLAFDGAKDKLVHKLGYPEQVLDFEYDHEVRERIRKKERNHGHRLID